MKRFIIGLILIMAFLTGTSYAQTKQGTQKLKKSDDSHHHNTHGHHRLHWPWYHHGKGKHSHDHSNRKEGSDKKHNSTENRGN